MNEIWELFGLAYEVCSHYIHALVFQMVYSTVYMYSVCEIHLTPYIQASWYKPMTKHFCEFVKNGEVIHTCSLTDIQNREFKDELWMNYDFMVCHFLEKNEMNMRQKIYRNIPDRFESECTDVRLILTEIKIGDHIHEIKFREPHCHHGYDYFVVDNVIDHRFMQYFLTRHYPALLDELEKHNQVYELHVLDNEVNSCTVKMHESIEFRKCNIHIMKCKEENEEWENVNDVNDLNDVNHLNEVKKSQ